MKYDVKKITGVAVLLAIEIVLQTIGNFITLGPISINLSLIPIALGAILYGPLAGALLGFINGLLVLFAPSTQAIFMAYAPLGTVITCLFKCTIAGFISGLVYKLIAKKNSLVATIIASLLVPIINTGLFIVGCYIFFSSWVIQGSASFSNQFTFFLMGVLGWNFLFEFGVTSILSTTLARIIRIVKKEQ